MRIQGVLSWSSAAWLTLAAAKKCNGTKPVPYQLQTPPLDTPWTEKVGTEPWPDHPRPQLQRDAWKNLNGIWTYQKAASDGDLANPPTTKHLTNEVLIPSCMEGAISGIQDTSVEYMWFKTQFEVPEDWSENVLLNFEAVDYEATVFVNGQQVGHNAGGYFRFTVDVTEAAVAGQKNDLLVFVHDPTDSQTIPVGKQTNDPSHIFYRSCSGIWQTVWLESAPADHITQLDVAAGMDGTVKVTAHSSAQQGAEIKATVMDQDGGVLVSETGTADQEFTLTVDSPNLWSPDSPTLYNLTVSLGDDEVHSYTGFRSMSVDKVDGVMRPLLNNEFHFIFGTLDQGFWPDGIYTPPTYEAMVFDLHLLKDLGFNMVRKHIKVEPDLFYRACDEIGLMVIQDMPSLPVNGGKPLPNPAEQEEFNRQYQILINEHKSYTSIVTWVIYNEGWGQLNQPPWPEASLTEWTREADPSRLIDSVTGWNDHGYGDFSDNHHYANPQCGTPFWSLNTGPYDETRIGFQGEFGGIGHNVSAEHLWKVEEAILHIDQTYEINNDLDSYNYRASVLFREFREQIERYACSGGVWTQTTDVEGEVNGLVTYDRRLKRVDEKQWKADIQALYDAAAARGGAGNSTMEL